MKQVESNYKECNNKLTLKTIFQKYLEEFEENISDIMKLKETEFMFKLSNKIKSYFQLHYREYNYDQIREAEIQFYKEIYKRVFLLISQELEQFEINQKISARYSPTIYLRNYFRHCFKNEKAIHKCGGKFISIFDEDKKLSYVVCSNCKSTYTPNYILMYCEPCNEEYYSSHLLNYNKELQLATWEKYHCGALINDTMKCIKCKEPFYITKNSNLKCINPKCKLEVDPMRILWDCILCGKEFKTRGKIYNPLEFKAIKLAISNAINVNMRALPNFDYCCRDQVELRNLNFFHNKICNGKLNSGKLFNQEIIVCSKCKIYTDFNKFIWTCPQCLEVIKNKNKLMTNLINDCIKEENKNFRKKSMNIEFSINKTNLEMKEIRKISPTKLRVHTPKRSSQYDIMNPKSESKQRFSAYDTVSISRNKFSIKNPIRNSLKSANKQEYSDEEQNQEDFESNFSKSSNCFFNKENNSNNVRKSLNFNQLNRIRKSSVSNRKSSPISREAEEINLNVLPKTNFDSNEIDVKNYMSENSKTSSFNIYMKKSIEKAKKEIVEPITDSLIEFEIEDYNIITLIGEGTFGKIYLVEDKNKNIFSMKKLIINDEQELRSFRQEYELVSTFKHTNILTIKGICERKLDLFTHVLYILMEVGITDWEKEIKSRQIRKQFYKEDELLAILKQLLSSLVYLQSNNIAHRDIKPQNILIFKNDIFKLADFGEAKLMRRSEMSQELSTLRGTELYMSPLLFVALNTNQKDIQHNSYKSDVFSLGLCFLYAATLSINSLYEFRNKFDEKTVHLLINRFLKGRYSSEFIELITKMLEINEEKRLDFYEVWSEFNKNFVKSI